MRSKPAKLRRPIGRPPAGARDGERVKDYPQLSIRVPAEVIATLQALSLVSARPQWRVVAEAIDCYLRGRSDAEQSMVDEFLGRSRSRSLRRTTTRRDTR